MMPLSPFRLRTLATAASIWLACTLGAAACPSATYPGPGFTFAGADLYAPQAFSTVASGSGALSSCGIPNTRGYANDTATMSLNLSMMDGYELVLDVQSECDSTLLVNAADGSWSFDDDTGEGVMLRIVLADPARLNGRVDIWIGSYGGGTCPATITLQTRRAPGMPDEAGDVPLGATGCPDPTLTGRTLSFNGVQLWSRQSIATTASGGAALGGCDLPGTRGYAGMTPSFTFYLSGMEGYRLDLDVEATCDSTLLVRAADGSWHFDDDGNGNLDPALSFDQYWQTNGRVDVWVGSYGGSSCAATLNLETFDAAMMAPPPQPAGSLAGTWRLVANGYSGTLTFTPNGLGWSGQLNLGRQEVLQDVWFDPASDRVEFFRPDPTYPQHYVGTVANGEMTGHFSQSGGDYVYAWRAQR